MLNIEYVKNLQWENAEKNYFSCVVKYKEFLEELPAGINGIDPEKHIRAIWENALIGAYGEIADWVYVAPPPSPNYKQSQPVITGLQTL